jgi:hypothetical protein
METPLAFAAAPGAALRMSADPPAVLPTRVVRRSVRSTRRDVLRLAALAATGAVLPAIVPPHIARAATSASGRQLVNGVLSAYGLPQLRDVDGFTPLLEQYARLVVQFQYPSAWIVARNVLASETDSADIAQSTARLSFGSSAQPMEGRASGLTVGDYRKAEGLSFYVSGGMPPEKRKVQDLPVEAILDLCTPGDATGQAAEYKVTKDVYDEETGYRTVSAKYESTTVSGYTVERRLVTSATMLPDGKLYALAGSCSENRMKKIGDTMAAAVRTFRVYRL